MFDDASIRDEDKCRTKLIEVLGLIWDTEDDVLSLAKIKSKCENGNLTKRSMLQRVASVFDPVGLFAPVVLKFKLLLQELWKNKIGWDKK